MSCVYIYLSCHMKSQEICMRNASVFAHYVFVQRIGHIITALAKPCVLLSSCVFKDAQTVKSFWAHGLWRPECQANSAAIISSSFCLFSSLFLDEKVDFKVKEGFFLSLFNPPPPLLLEFLLCCFCFLSVHTTFVFPSPVFFTHRVDASQNAVTFQMQMDEWAFLSCQNVNVLSFLSLSSGCLLLRTALAGCCDPQAFSLRLHMCSVLLNSIMTPVTNKKAFSHSYLV